MSKTIWHKGPPPSIGWWPASLNQDRNILRWWDGEAWSFGAQKWMSPAKAAAVAGKRDDRNQHRIMWTDRPKLWPERSKT